MIYPIGTRKLTKTTASPVDPATLEPVDAVLTVEADARARISWHERLAEERRTSRM